jgi:hypothetical protein
LDNADRAMKRKSTWKGRAIHGGATGALITGVAMSLAVFYGPDLFPALRVEGMDPFFIEHAILVFFIYGVYTGAVIGGLTANPRFTEK